MSLNLQCVGFRGPVPGCQASGGKPGAAALLYWAQGPSPAGGHGNTRESSWEPLPWSSRHEKCDITSQTRAYSVSSQGALLATEDPVRGTCRNGSRRIWGLMGSKTH